VIHRDIKPSNIIRRRSDGRLVLIDFGAVKQIPNKLADPEIHLTTTIGVGTEGYMPSEQAAGMPKVNSDLYALGIIAIEALTGIPAYALKRDVTGNILWRKQVPQLVEDFARVLQKLVQFDFTQRYQSTAEVLADLEPVAQKLGSSQLVCRPVVPVGVAWEEGIDLKAATDQTEMLPGDWFSDVTLEDNG
jgi:serine/threonine protein kinase